MEHLENGRFYKTWDSMFHNDPVSLDNLESSYLTQLFLMHGKASKKKKEKFGHAQAESIFCSFIHRHELKTYIKKKKRTAVTN